MNFLTQNNPPRVLHVVESWQPRTTGYTIRSWALITAQARAAYVEPHVLVTSRQQMYGFNSVTQPPLLNGRLHLAEVSPRERSLRRAYGSYIDRQHLAQTIRHLCETQRIDLIHSHWSSGVGAAAAQVASELGLPLVAEVRFDLAGATMVETVRWPAPGLEALLRRLFERYLRRADAIVAASYSLADLLRRDFPQRASRITVVPNGVNSGLFRPAAKDEALASELGLAGKVVIGSTSNMLRYEGLDRLLHVLPAVQAEVPNLCVLLVGSGTQFERLQSQAQQHKLPVVFSGRVPKEAVPRYLNLMDIFAVPRRAASITQFASPLKVVEAMACGLPVVGSATGDMSTLLADGRGCLTAPDLMDELVSALIALGRDAERRRAMGQQARAWAEQHLSWAETVGIYREVYGGIQPHSASLRPLSPVEAL